MNLDAIEVRLTRPHGCRHERAHRLLDAFARHLDRRDRGAGHLENVVRHRPRRNRRFTTDVRARVAPGVTKLDRRLGAVCMQRVRQTAQSRHEAIIVDPELAEAMPAHALRRCHLDGHEASPTGSTRGEVRDRGVADSTVLVRKARRHRGHHDPIA